MPSLCCVRTIMGSTESSSPAPTAASTEKTGEKKLKPCCACPETRKVRDECIMEKGAENCADLIETHKDCMRKLGFKV